MSRPAQPLGLASLTLQPLTLELRLEPERQGTSALRPAILAALSAHGRLVIEAILVVDGGG